jgi:hypothetical protein
VKGRRVRREDESRSKVSVGLPFALVKSRNDIRVIMVVCEALLARGTSKKSDDGSEMEIVDRARLL